MGVIARPEQANTIPLVTLVLACECVIVSVHVLPPPCSTAHLVLRKAKGRVFKLESLIILLEIKTLKLREMNQFCSTQQGGAEFPCPIPGFISPAMPDMFAQCVLIRGQVEACGGEEGEFHPLADKSPGQQLRDPQ